MPDFRRNWGETHAAWLARLRAVRPDGLNRDQINELTACRIEAGAAVRRGAGTKARRDGGAARRVAQAKGPMSDALHRCIDAVGGLSPADARRMLA